MGAVRLPAILETLHDPAIQVTLGRAILVLKFLGMEFPFMLLPAT
jgi:hypothetical protein